MLLIEAGADRDKVRLARSLVHPIAAECAIQPNTDDQIPEQVEGLGGREQKKVREFVWSKVGKE